MYRIPLFDLNFDEAEEGAVLDVLRSRWISMGRRTEMVEERFEELLGAKHALALTNCTAALHLALVALGIQPGDEVIVPSLTFVATVNCVRYVGATPVFADIKGPENLTVDPVDIERLITPRTRAIIVMHYGGFACDMEAIAGIAARHRVRLVEDAAHAPDVSHVGRKLGTWGDVGCFSFFSNKNVSCAEGGLLVTSDPEVARRVKLLRSHGMTTLSYQRAQGHATRYDVAELGFNYRLDDVRAALLLAQLGKLSEDKARRARVRQDYVSELGDAVSIHIPFGQAAKHSSNYIFPIVLRSGGEARRDRVRAALSSAGIETSIHYPPVHRFAFYSAQSRALPQTEFVADHQITLPMYGSLQREQVVFIANSLKAALAP